MVDKGKEQNCQVQVPLELAPNRDKMGGVLKNLTFLNMVLQVDN